MYYLLDVSCGRSIEDQLKITEPIMLRTATLTKEEVKPEEIEMVTEAFKQQIKGILETLILTKL